MENRVLCICVYGWLRDSMARRQPYTHYYSAHSMHFLHNFTAFPRDFDSYIDNGYL